MNKLFVFSMLIIAIAGHSDPLGVHGMLLFGNNTNYISHLPMFHTPHDYQLIAEVLLLEKGRGTTLKKYDRLKGIGNIFTIVPEPMDLSKVIRGEITEFGVTVYQGHFERGGKPIGPAVVKMDNIFVAEKIDKKKGASTGFLSFGKSGEYYLAHLITGQPTYDAIYVSPVPTKLIFPPCGRGHCPEPITKPISDNNLPLTIQSGNALFGSVHPQNVTIGSEYYAQVSVGGPFYLEYNELAH